jgi:two-component system, OmpR family, sensor kinase
MVSLTLAGGLTWTLVSNLELGREQDQLAKNALQIRQQIASYDCIAREPVPPTGALKCTAPVGSEHEFLDMIAAHRSSLSPGERLILLDRPPMLRGKPTRQPWVLYDSEGSLSPGTPVPLGKETIIFGQRARQGSTTFNGQRYLLAATPLSSRYASWIVLARPYDYVAAHASTQLLRPILLSGGAGLLLAIVVTLLLSRALTKPLDELRGAAEDIAGGNYARRVRATGGDEIGVVGQAFNRMADAVERARAQQRGFLANVSHELKTPLTSLIGFTQALMDGSLQSEEEKARAAAILHEEAQRVLRMSRELLDLARVESGQLTLDLHPVDLGAQLHQEIEIVRPRAEGRELVLQLATPASLPPVKADPDRLHQILENLLDNAIKYAPAKTSVWISAETRPGGRIITSVTNQVGARAPDPQRMFDRFYRADPSRAAGGVGLGLAICRELAAAQNGRLTAALGADGSLCMTLDLPAAAQPPAEVEVASRLPVRLEPRPQTR